jgi:NAD(P)-dependent dehydrogenase (short-subunit alcohol dehydrogenase family)
MNIPGDDRLGAVVVTGGSRGIGRAAAILLAEAGYEVVLTFREKESAADDVVRRIRSSGGRAAAVRLNLNKDDVVSWFSGVDGTCEGRLIGLVNNAASVPGRRRLVDADLAEWRLAFEVNVIKLAQLCREGIARMARSRGGQGGAIVNVTSQVAIFGAAELAGYAASKGAVNALTLSLARECGPEGIRVNAVSPGLIVDEDGGAGDDRQRAQLSQIPLGRLGNPADVGEMIAWLISPKASFVTGAIIPVHGGR